MTLEDLETIGQRGSVPFRTPLQQPAFGQLIGQSITELESVAQRATEEIGAAQAPILVPKRHARVVRDRVASAGRRGGAHRLIDEAPSFGDLPLRGRSTG